MNMSKVCLRAGAATFLLVGIGFLRPTNAQQVTEANITGTWEGSLSVPGSSLRIVFHFNRGDDGTYSGTMDSPDQGANGIPLGTISVEADEVDVSVPMVAGSYAGTLDGDSIDGRWSQGGQSFPLELKREKAKSAEGESQSEPGKGEGETQALGTEPGIDVVGSWMGTLTAGAMRLRIVFHLEKNEAGSLGGTMDSPDQGATGIPLGEVKVTRRKLTIGVPSAAVTYEGTVDEDGLGVEGTWNQGGRSLPLRLEPAAEEDTKLPERPQEPKPPYPYREEEVRFAGAAEDVELAGTLTLPEGEGPFTAAILISGSGPQNRNEELLGHKPFLVLADHLTREGIAVLRYDDRGVGESTGDFVAATMLDFADDARSAVEFIKSRPEIDADRIGLIGHSEGGVVAPMVAADSPDVSFVVMMAGSAVLGEDLLYAQSELIMRASGATDEIITRDREASEALYAIAKKEGSRDELNKELRAYLVGLLEKMTDEEKALSGLTEQTIDVQVEVVSSPWLRHFISYDPRPALRSLTCPALAIFGEKDLQVPPDQNLPEMEKALADGGNEQSIVHEFAGLNHLFQHAETGAPNEYAQIEETFAPVALEKISSWIKEL